MGVFICWSGDRSKAIAQALQTLLSSILSPPPSIFLSEHATGSVERDVTSAINVVHTELGPLLDSDEGAAVKRLLAKVWLGRSRRRRDPRS